MGFDITTYNAVWKQQQQTQIHSSFQLLVQTEERKLNAVVRVESGVPLWASNVPAMSPRKKIKSGANMTRE